VKEILVSYQFRVSRNKNKSSLIQRQQKFLAFFILTFEIAHGNTSAKLKCANIILKKAKKDFILHCQHNLNFNEDLTKQIS
jgi:hypothetical protein